MQKCEKCNSQFSWSKIFNSFWWTYKPIVCDNCGTKHKITILSRFKVVGMTFLPMWIYLLFVSPFVNFFVSIGIGISIAIIGFLFTPFVVRYKEAL